MTIKIQGDKITFPDDSEQTTAYDGSSGGVPEAPIDGKEYARKDAEWVEVTGGDAVAFRGELSANQTVVSDTWTKVNLDTASVDTDNAFVDSKFKPSVAGYYQVNASVYQNCNPGSIDTRCCIYKNGSNISTGNSLIDYATPSLISNNSSTGSDIIYLNGTTDYLELGGYVYSTGTCGVRATNTATFLSAVLVTGGTGTGGIPEAPVDGKQYGRQDEEWTEVTGGGEVQEAVVFRGVMSTNQTVTKDTWTKVNIDNAEFDTDNALTADGKFKPTVKGWYQVNAIASDASTPTATSSISAIYKNNTIHSRGTLVTAEKSVNSIVADIIYLDPDHVLDDGSVGDYLELYARITATGTCTISPTATNTYLSASLITGQSSGGGSGGGTTDILPVLSSGAVNSDGTVNLGIGFTSTKLSTGKYRITFDKPRDSLDYSVTVGSDNTGSKPSVSSTNRKPESFDIFTISASDVNTGDLIDGAFSFVVTGTETIAVGGGSGGGSYTPEAMVWEDVSAERAFDTEYTNTNDVPIYVQAYFSGTSAGANSVRCRMDGAQIGYVGNNSTTGGSVYVQMPMFIVPSGSTYEFQISGGTSLVSYWREARMPVAIGTGGKTVAFRGELSAGQTGLTTTTWTKLNLNTTSIDTDNALVDGKFKPSVAGYYQVNGAVREACSPTSTQTVASIYKNGSLGTVGSYGVMDESTNASVNDIIYLDGKSDYLELFGQVKSTGTCGIASPSKDTFLSAILVSGGSGDSIWTEEDGKAVYDGDVIVGGSSSNGTGQLQVTDGVNYTFDVKSGGAGSVTVGGTSGTSLQLQAGGNIAMTIDGNPTTGKVKILSPSGLQIQNPQTTDAPSNVPNCYIGSAGDIVKQTNPTVYSIEQVDKKLAIKDKLIEKLSARLDAIEKKVK